MNRVDPHDPRQPANWPEHGPLGPSRLGPAPKAAAGRVAPRSYRRQLTLEEGSLGELQLMLDDWQTRRQAILADTQGYGSQVALADLAKLDESVVVALVSLLRLGGRAFLDSGMPLGLIVHARPLVYGVVVHTDTDGTWGVHS